MPVATHPLREWVRLVAPRAGARWITRHETGWASTDAVYRDFDRWVARQIARERNAGVIYAYEDAAEASFVAGRELGWRRFYDLPIAYWETSHRLLAEEAERWPAWNDTLESTRNSPGKLARKTRELELADTVICPSEFVARSLPSEARTKKRIVIARFGSPTPRQTRPDGPGGARLRVLFVGSMSQRKGLADLFAAMKQLGRRDVELVVLGSPVAAPGFYRSEYPGFTYERPRPHADVLALMATCDVFCLPSIVEGRALVVQEAMSAGLPAIVTGNTGADDAVEEGKNGFVVPIRSAGAIAERLAWLADHRDALPAFSAAAKASAARFTWDAYGDSVLRTLDFS
jgi:glycosyltransferase involved in cell wall biosynthesis